MFVEVGDQAQIGNPFETARSFFKILQYGTVAVLGAEDETVKRVPVLIISWTYPALVPSKIFVGVCVKTNVCADMLYPFYSFVIEILLRNFLVHLNILIDDGLGYSQVALIATTPRTI